MFKRLDQAAAQASAASVRISINGAEALCNATDSVAAALFAQGLNACRDTVVGGVARGPFCMMGVCYDCLVTIDGRPNQQGCMTIVREGMVVEHQHGTRKVRE